MGRLTESIRAAEGKAPATRLLESGATVRLSELAKPSSPLWKAARRELRGKQWAGYRADAVAEVLTDLWQRWALENLPDEIPAERGRYTFLLWRVRDWRERRSAELAELEDETFSAPVSMVGMGGQASEPAEDRYANPERAARAAVDIAETLNLPGVTVWALQAAISGAPLEELADEWGCELSAAQNRVARGKATVREQVTAAELMALISEPDRPQLRRRLKVTDDGWIGLDHPGRPAGELATRWERPLLGALD